MRLYIQVTPRPAEPDRPYVMGIHLSESAANYAISNRRDGTDQTPADKLLTYDLYDPVAFAHQILEAHHNHKLEMLRDELLDAIRDVANEVGGMLP